MLLRRLITVFRSDVNSVLKVPRLIIASASPLIIILILLSASGYISFPDNPENAIPLRKYYSIVAISLISAIPFIYGLIFSYIHSGTAYSPDKLEWDQTPVQILDLYFLRLIISGLSAFTILLAAIFITDVVPSEGWLRSVYVSGLLATMTIFIGAVSTVRAGEKRSWRLRAAFSLLFYLPAPLGLLLHHPWNYLAFFSPFYWINWAWIITAPAESLTYGLISLLLTALILFIFYRKYRSSVLAG